MKRLPGLRLAVHRLMERLPGKDKTSGAPSISKPDWLLLLFDVCWLIGLLGLTLYISWIFDNLPAGDPILYHTYALRSGPILLSFIRSQKNIRRSR